MWDKKTNKLELPRQFYPHHRHQERLLSSYPFLGFMGKRLRDLIDRKNTSERSGSVNADKSKLSRSKLEASETEWIVMWRKTMKKDGPERIKEVVVVEVRG